MRFNAAADSQQKYEQYQKMFEDGLIDDRSIAVRTQQHLNLESQLDSDFMSPRSSQPENLSSISANILSRNSRLDDQFPLFLQEAPKIPTQLPQDFSLQEREETELLSQDDSLAELPIVSQQSDKIGSLSQTKNEFWEQVNDAFQSSVGEPNNLKKSTQPTLIAEELEDEDLLTFHSAVSLALLLIAIEKDKLEDQESEQIMKEQSKILQLDDSIDQWIDAVVKQCQTKLDQMDNDTEQLKKQQKSLGKEEKKRSNDTDDAETAELERRERAKRQLSDILFELLDIQYIEFKGRHDIEIQNERDIALLEFAKRTGLPRPPVPNGAPQQQRDSVKDQADILFEQQIGDKVKQKQKKAPTNQ